jgi:hypothetical protein
MKTKVVKFRLVYHVTFKDINVQVRGFFRWYTLKEVHENYKYPYVELLSFKHKDDAINHLNEFYSRHYKLFKLQEYSSITVV